MYVALVRSTRRAVLLVTAVVCIMFVAGCGGSSDESATTDSDAIETSADIAVEADDDHDDDDHDDDHDDDEDHDDDHDDDDHDDDHDDDDHDDEGASGGLDAHVHGSAELFVAWNGSDVVVDLISPANNIFGFEYEATTDEDLAIVAERTDVLTARGLLAFNDQAACSLAADVDSEFEIEGSHAEVTTSWLFTCEEPGELSQLDLTALFTEFPGLQDIDVQWASEAGQSAAELSPSSTILQFN
jgi:hypothetical protein